MYFHIEVYLKKEFLLKNKSFLLCSPLGAKKVTLKRKMPLQHFTPYMPVIVAAAPLLLRSYLYACVYKRMLLYAYLILYVI